MVDWMIALTSPNVTSAVASALRTQSACVPVDAVALSQANRAHAGLRALGLQRMPPCFLARLVSVCFGEASACGHCADAPSACVLGAAVEDSSFGKGAYVHLIFFKWRVLADALLAARWALWLDADVVLLQNPWEALGRPLGKWSIRYSLEASPCGARAGKPHCPARASEPHCPLLHEQAVVRAKGSWVQTPHALNSGQMLLTDGALAEAVYARRPTAPGAVWDGRRVLDQTIAQASWGAHVAFGPQELAMHCAAWNRRALCVHSGNGLSTAPRGGGATARCRTPS